MQLLKKYIVLFPALALSVLLLHAQDGQDRYDRQNVATIGFGFGLDYGGLGANFTVYPQKNIGLFAGGGYAFAGFGYNTGIKLRLNPAKYFVPFFTAMYGYNAAVVVSGNSGYGNSNFNKIFYGPSAGLGFDLGSIKKGYLSIAVLVPFRSADVNNYIDELKNVYGAEFTNSLLPIAFSIGYKHVIL